MTTPSGPDVVALHTRAVEGFTALVRAVPADAWSSPTPNPEWDLRTLVNHVAGEQLWTVPLLEGRTIGEVGDRYDGDVLGGSPVAAVDAAAKSAIAAFEEPGATDRVTHLSFGDTPATEYGMQLVADYLIHGWDLAVASGGDGVLDPELVAAVAPWFAGVEDLYRQAGAIGERPEVEPASEQDKLLVAFGRDPSWRRSS